LHNATKFYCLFIFLIAVATIYSQPAINYGNNTQQENITPSAV